MSQVGQGLASDHRIEAWDIRERDIDLLLIEELYSSPSFRDRLFELLGGIVPCGTDFIAARHSVSFSLGQSDVEVDLEVGAERWLLMIENKIAAEFQPEQAKRYAQRAEHYKKSFAKVLTVLVAPARYLGGERYGFDFAIKYEDILDWFNNCPALGERRHCKVSLLKAAIDKCECNRNNPSTKNPQSIAFFHEYWRIASVLAPELRMIDEVKDGGFLYFHPANLPKYLKLMHRIRTGYVDLQFCGLANSTDELRSAFAKVLPADFEVRRVTGSAAIGLAVPRLLREGDFEPQRERVEDSIREVQRLWAWFRLHGNAWNPNSELTRTGQ